jgi:hypothetical protein
VPSYATLQQPKNQPGLRLCVFIKEALKTLTRRHETSPDYKR